MVNRREVRFTIDAYTPETIPMARLAEYMADVAVLLGEPSNVHFIRIEPGSLTLVQWIEPEAVPKVEHRLAQIRRGNAPPDAVKTMRLINRKLQADNASGVLSSHKEKEILTFPGRRASELGTFGAFNQQGSLDGTVVRVGGRRKELARVLLESGADVYYTCVASRAIAKQLAMHLFTAQVRVYGTGRWHREENSQWVLDRFTIKSFEVLNDEPLTAVVSALRDLPGSEWPTIEDPWAELNAIRHGPDESA
jgi:hypothetical protein